MYKKIITILCVLIVLVGVFITGNTLLKTYKDKDEQDVVITEQKEIDTNQSDDLNQNTIETEKEEIVTADRNAPEKTVVQEEATTPDDRLLCTLSVNCSSVLKNIQKLKENKRNLIPKDGIILKEIQVEFFPDESVFDVLQRELKNSNIHFEFVKTPAYNSAYIEGIANLYEFDCGEFSGWLYEVNGIKPTYGCSRYKLKNNDRIVFFYSCNMLE